MKGSSSLRILIKSSATSTSSTALEKSANSLRMPSLSLKIRTRSTSRVFSSLRRTRRTLQIWTSINKLRSWKERRMTRSLPSIKLCLRARKIACRSLQLNLRHRTGLSNFFKASSNLSPTSRHRSPTKSSESLSNSLADLVARVVSIFARSNTWLTTCDTWAVKSLF